MKQSRKDNKRLRFFGAISSIIIVAVAIVCAVFAVLGSNGKDKDNVNLNTSYTDDYYTALLQKSNQIDVGYLAFNYVAASDSYVFAGFNENALKSAFASESALVAYLESKSYINIPSTFSGLPVDSVNIDNSNHDISDALSYLEIAQSYVKAITIPKSVTYIAPRSFWGFGDLEYFETPFIGTNRGSSANYIKDDSTVSYPLVKMFSDTVLKENGKYYAGRIYDTATVNDRKSLITYWYEEEIQFDIDNIQNADVNVVKASQFHMPYNLQKIVVTNELEFGNHALYNLTSVRTIEIKKPSDLDSNHITFGYYAMSECTSLVNVILPERNTILSEGLFAKTGLTSVKLPGRITELPRALFANCNYLTSVTIPTSIKDIGYGAFYQCGLLTDIDLFSDTWDTPVYSTYDIALPQGLTTIGADAFFGCKSVKEFFVPDEVTFIGGQAFAQCTTLEKITLPFAGAHKDQHFDDCDPADKTYDHHSLLGWVFEHGGSSTPGVSYVASQYYSTENTNLVANFSVPETLKTIVISNASKISTGALQNFKTVIALTINPECKNIAVGCANGMGGLQNLTIGYLPNNRLGSIFAGSEFSDNNSIATPGGTGYRIPSNLYNVNITNQATIRTGTFAECTPLKLVEIGEATTYIEEAIFYMNPNLEQLILPFVGCFRGEFGVSDYWWWWWRDRAWRNTLQWAFSSTYHADTYANDSLRYYDSYRKFIPRSLKTVEITDEHLYGTYSFRNFSSVQTLNLDINAEVLDAKGGSISENALHGMSNLKSLTIPFVGATQNVNGASGRNYTLGYIFGTSSYGNSYPVSQYSTYYIPKGLASVEIGDVSNTFATNAFKDCESITTISSNANIVQLGASCFANCINLSTLDLPNASYTHASNYAFFNCKKLYDISKYTPKTVKTIGNYTFAGTSIGTTISGTTYGIKLDDYYDSIGAYAFSNCLELESVVIPVNGISGSPLKLGEGVFAGCQYLKNVELLNKNVTKNMFKDCISLVSIDFTKITMIPEGIFNGCKSLEYYDDVTGIGFKQDVATASIGAYAFKGCESLDRFDILPSTTIIHKGAFQGCTGFEDMTIPVETVTIESNGWDGCDMNFCFWVYEPEEYWSSGWVDNWNCDYPVYVIGEVDEEIFTYQYDIEERKYYVTGVKAGKELEGIVAIPSYHNGIKVIGIDSTLALEDGASRISAHNKITKIILPKTVTKIIGTLTPNVRVDIYTQLTKAEVDKALRTSYEANLATYTDYKDYYAASPNTAFKDYPYFDIDNHHTDSKIKGWVRGSKNINDNLIVSDEVRGWFGGTGFLYYADDWEFGTGLAKNVPYLKSSSIRFVLADTGSLVYTSEAIEPNVDYLVLPGEVCNVNEDSGSYDDGALDEYSAVLNETQLFAYTYANNVQVGTASIKAVINRTELALHNEGLDFQLLLVGNGKATFEILKCPINLFWNMGNMTPENFGTHLYGASQYSNYIYNGSNWTNSVWGTANVMGLETFNNVTFSGTLATSGVNAGIYAYSSQVPSGYDYSDAIGDTYRGGFKWISPWRVYRNGVDISKNFYINLTLEVEIQRLDVELEMVSDSYRETSSGKVYQYRYIGEYITPVAKAIKHTDGTDVTSCIVKTAYVDPSTKAMYPTGTAAAGGAATYRTYAWISNPMNYRLVDSDGNGNDYLESFLRNPQGSPDVSLINPNLSVMVGSQYVVAIEEEIEVIKGLITINPQVIYTIPVDADRWENSTWVNGTYITGLGPNTVFSGKLVTSGVDELNTTADKNTDYLWQDYSTTGYILKWEDTTISSHDDVKLYNKTGKYHIYNTKYEVDSYYMNELQYYDVVESNDMFVRIKYNDFEIEYFVTDAQTNAKQFVTYTDEVASDNSRHRIAITYAVDGKDYTLEAEAIAAQIELLKNYTLVGEAYSKLYYTDDGYSTTTQPIKFNEPDMQYRVAVMITGRHFNTYYANIELKTIKSDVVFDTINDTTITGKEYDRLAINMDEKILKRGLDYSQDQSHPEYIQEFQFIYYKNGQLIEYTPTEAGSYQVRIIGSETKYFNPCDKTFNFEITKRKLTFDINITKTYDGTVISYTPGNSVLKQILPNESLPRLLDDDTYMGTVMTQYTTPNTYSAELGNLKWSPIFKVYYKDGTDVTQNYEVILDGEMKIVPRIFQYTAPDKVVPYSGNPVSIDVTVTYPTTGYTIYYSSYPIDEFTNLSYLYTWDSANFEPGVYTHYFAIVADYFETVYDSATVTIENLEIEYEDPAMDSVSGATDGDAIYTMEYTGGSQDYIVKVLAPWNGVVYYSTDNKNWTTSYYSFTDVGVYNVYYKIEAPYHTSIPSTPIQVKIVVPDDPLPSDSYFVQAYEELYDGDPHSLTAKWAYSLDGWSMIYYSIDGGQTWLDRNPEFIDAGKYDVAVKFVAQGYAPKIINSYVHIKNLAINVEFVDYEGTFDGQYHNLGLKLNAAGILAGDSLVLDPDNNRYYYNGVELNYFYTTEFAVAHADAQWIPRITTNAAGDTVYNLGFKDYKSGGYYVYLKLTAENHEDTIFVNGEGKPTYGIVKINYLDNPSFSDEYKTYEYCKAPIYPTIDTVHDGKVNYYFYPAYEDANGNPTWDSTTAKRISAPQELGVYFVRMQFLPSNNCAAMTAEVYFKIVPKTLEVKWTDTVYYDGTEKSPNPYVETGTDDQIHIIFQVLGTQTPIECGTYQFAVSIYEITENYVLDRYTVDLTIVKREIVVKIEDEMEALKDNEGNYLPWTHNEYPLYSPNEKNPWALLGLPLLTNHQFIAEMETDKGLVGKYYYTTLNNNIYINKVNVKSWDIIVVDASGNPLKDSNGNYISARDYYTVEFDIIVSIVNPKIDLKDCVNDKIVEYDGYEHTIDITGLPAGSTIFYINPNDGRGYVTPIFYNLAGSYEINFFVSCEGYQDTYSKATLTIERAKLDIDIVDLDPNNEGLDIYDGLEHTNDYVVNKIKDGNLPGVKTFPAASGETGHRRYYSVNDISLTDLMDFYDDFNEYNKIFTKYAKETIKDAGDYYCVVYYADSPNRWFASYGVDIVTIEKKDIDVTFNSSFYIDRYYNGNKERIPLTTATIDDSDLIQDPKHTMDVSDLSLCFIQTISANAGLYEGKTGFEFGAMKIFDENGVNVAHNYHPVVSDNVRVNIKKAPLKDEDFIVTDYLDRIYDGLVAAPHIKTPSDGQLEFYFMIIDEFGNPTTCSPSFFQSDVGQYYVGVKIGEGTNYQAWFGDYKWAYVTVLPKEVEITWEDTELTFNGQYQSANASITDVYGSKIDLLVNYFLDDGLASEVINAGGYEGKAEFDPAMDNYESYIKNYILTNDDVYLYINKLRLQLQLGDGVINNTDTNNLSTPHNNDYWSKRVYSVQTTGYPEVLELPDFITLKGIYQEYPRLYTVSQDSGIYYGNDDFNTEDICAFVDDVNVTDSIEYDIIGSVTIFANSIIFNTKPKTIEYKENTVYDTLASLDCLVVTNPTSPSDWTTSAYSMEKIILDANGDPQVIEYAESIRFPNYVDEETGIDYRISDVGTYIIYFTISDARNVSEKYADVRASVTITIEQKEAYIEFNDNLSKVYDGVAVNVDTSNISSGSGFNGDVNDLCFNFVELVVDSNGVITEIPLGVDSYGVCEKPVDAGKYKVYITSSKDSSGILNQNYTALNVCQYFEISPKKLEVTFTKDLEVYNDGAVLGLPYNSTNITLTAGSNLTGVGSSGLISGDQIRFAITSLFDMQRNKYKYKGTLRYIEPTMVGSTLTKQANKFTALIGTNEFDFNLAWEVNRTQNVNGVPEILENEEGIPIDISKNYYIDFQFELYVHYPLIDAVISGGDFNYDPSASYHGTCDLTKVDASIKANLIQYYSPRLDDVLYYPSANAKTAIDDPAICYNLPGSYTVYYRLFTDPTAATTDVAEDLIGSFVINISYMERQNFVVEDLGKIYDKNPAGILNASTNEYIPKITLNDPDDALDLTKLTIRYQKVGSSSLIDPKLGCVDAGTYQYYLVIPGSTYYGETVVEGRFVISQATIKIESIKSLAFIYDSLAKSFTFDSTNTNTQTYFKTTEILGNGNQTDLYDPTCPLRLTGILVTNDSIVKDNNYSGKEGSINWMYSNYRVVDNLTGNDVTLNYRVNIEDVVMEISPQKQTYINLTPAQIPYNGQMHTISIKMTNPSNTSKTKILYKNDDGVYTENVVYKMHVGSYTIDIKIVTPNYETLEASIPLNIVKAIPYANIAENLTQDYNGMEVNLPGHVDTDNTETLFVDYQWEYYQLDETSGQYLGPIWDSVTTTGRRPIDAGKYRVVLVIPASANYEAVEVYKDFEIRRLATKLTWDASTFTYNGQHQAPKATLQQINSTEKVNVPLKYTINNSIGDVVTSSITVGGYVIKAEIDSSLANNLNYEIVETTKECSYNIVARRITISFKKYVDWTGSPIEFYSVTDPNIPTDAYIFDVDNLLPNDYFINHLISTATNKGVYVSMDSFIWDAGPDIYTSGSGSPVTSNYSFVYNIYLNITETAIDFGTDEYEVPYDGLGHSTDVEIYTEGDFTVYYSTTGLGDWTTYPPSFTEVGTHVTYIKIIDALYESSGGAAGVPPVENVYATIKILPADPQLDLLDKSFRLDKVYDGLSVDNPAVTYLGYTRNVKYTYKQILDDGTVKVLTKNPSDAGDYVLEIEVEPAESLIYPGVYNYKLGNKSIEFTIFKRDITLYIPTIHASKVYDGAEWSCSFNSDGPGDVIGLVPVKGVNPAHKFEGTLLTSLVDAGIYQTAEQFKWLNGYAIYDDIQTTSNPKGRNVTHNYELHYDMKVQIDLATLDVSFEDTVHEHDGNPYTISVTVNGRVVSFVDENGVVQTQTISDGTYNYQILYSKNDETDPYTTTPVTRTAVGETIVYVKVVATNFNEVKGSAWVKINGDGEGEEETDQYGTLSYTKSKVYDGDPIADPIYTTTSLGTQTLKYYEASDSLMTNPLASAPVDAGNYFFVLTVDAYADFPLITKQESFEITPKEVELVWENTMVPYDGLEHNPTAKYEKVDGTYQSTEDGTGILYITTLPKVAAGAYTVMAVSLDTNYKITNGQLVDGFKIIANTVDELVLDSSLTFGYLEEIVIKDVDGNIYEMDNDGNIIKVTDINQVENNSPNLPYKIIYDMSGTVGTHTIKVVLNDKTNTIWTTNLNSDDLEYSFEITPMEFPNPTYQILISLDKYSWVWTGGPIEPTPTVKLVKNEDNSVVKVLEDGIDYDVTYENNINKTTETSKAIVRVTCKGNFDYAYDTNFSITEEVPQVLTLGSTTIQYITADYSTETGVSIVEDGSIVHNKAMAEETSSIFLGHLYQGTTIEYVVNSFTNDKDLIEVRDQNDQVVSKEMYNFFFGSGYKVVLYDSKDISNRQVIDYVTGILYGDLDGDGIITSTDSSKISEITSGELTFETMNTACYFAGIVDRSVNVITSTSATYIDLYTQDAENYDFNSMFDPN